MSDTNLIYKLMDMTTLDKVLHVYHKFPYNASELETFVLSINEDFAAERRMEDRIHYSLETPCLLSLYVEGIGNFIKRWSSPDSVANYSTYSFDFYKYDSVTNSIEGLDLTNKKLKRICDHFLPFLVSRGKEKDLLPLLIVDHEELARFAIGI